MCVITTKYRRSFKHQPIQLITITNTLTTSFDRGQGEHTCDFFVTFIGTTNPGHGSIIEYTSELTNVSVVINFIGCDVQRDRSRAVSVAVVLLVESPSDRCI